MSQSSSLREFAEWVAGFKLVSGTYADEDHPYREWVTSAGDEMDFADVVEYAREVLSLSRQTGSDD